MLLEKLPLELVQDVLEHVLQDDKLEDSTALLGVNRVLEAETTRSIMRKITTYEKGTAMWASVPMPIRRRMAVDAIKNEPGPGSKFNIATYMHAVACHLVQYAKACDLEGAGKLSEKQWLHEIATVIAPPETDCSCGKPAFLHSRCHALSSVPDTAFHIAMLKNYIKLEVAMIRDGKGVRSACPYIKVSKRDLALRRRNALEWACASGRGDSVRRLVEAAEEQGNWAGILLPTAVAICAVHTRDQRDSGLDFLLDHIDRCRRRRETQRIGFWYQERLFEFRDWLRIVIIELAKRKNSEVIDKLISRYPYMELWTALDLCQGSPFQLMRKVFEVERPYCDLRKTYSESAREKHWMRCSKDLCHSCYSKAKPKCAVCELHHPANCENCGRVHGCSPPNSMYDYVGFPWSMPMYSFDWIDD